MIAVRGTAVLLTFVATLLLARCGGVGESSSSGCSLCGEFNDISGSISPQNGTQSQMRGWVVASFERDTGIARAFEVDNAGLFQLKQVRTDLAQTFALLSPDYILQAVLSIPGPVDNTISQFVKIKSQYLPRFIHKGTIITLQDIVGLSVTKDLAADMDGDEVPEGMLPIAGIDAALHGGFAMRGGVSGFSGFNLQAAANPLDQDIDGNPNETDPDIDGDGVINWLDTDDNGNGTLDVFDGDANGDLENDATPGQNDIDMYFKEGIEFLAVQFELKPKADGSGNETSLAFKVKVRDDVSPIAVQVRGAPSLLNGATYTQKDDTGTDQVIAFNRLLADDGTAEDSNPGDRLFGRRVVLDKAKSPRAYEVIFMQLVFGSEAAPWYMEFPYIFPDIKPAMITARYEPNMKSVLLIGNPFGTIQEFSWQILVFDSEDLTKPMWFSPLVLGTDRQYEIPDNILDPDKTYKYSVSAQVLDKIPGYPSYNITSKLYDLQ
jgi:hypothetical protein